MNAKSILDHALDYLHHFGAWMVGGILFSVRRKLFGWVFSQLFRSELTTTKEGNEMEKVIELSHEFKVDVKFENAVAAVAVAYVGKDGVEASLNLKVPAHIYLQKLKALIPGSLDDMLIDVAEPLLSKV